MSEVRKVIGVAICIVHENLDRNDLTVPMNNDANESISFFTIR